MTKRNNRTNIIRYDIKDRGRQYLGQERNFDTAAIAELINSGATQEKLKNGDMRGYFGHQIRMKYGMNPDETVFAGGKQVFLEPAIRTTKLTATPDGIIEHEVEFLDTVSGKLAKRLYDNSMGGFSSAIDVRRVGNKQLPMAFYGFDFVYEPNFTQNRGYSIALDGVMQGDFDPEADQQALLDAVNKIMDEQQQAVEQITAAMQQVMQENEELQAMLVKAGIKHDKALDGVMDIFPVQRKTKFDNAEQFLDAVVVPYDEVPEKEQPDQKRDMTPSGRFLSRRFGV